MVSSLHNGMNLVGKEFVASRLDDDGVLVLGPAGLVKRRRLLVIDRHHWHSYNSHHNSHRPDK